MCPNGSLDEEGPLKELCEADSFNGGGEDFYMYHDFCKPYYIAG
jgi:hypothetical protein